MYNNRKIEIFWENENTKYLPPHKTDIQTNSEKSENKIFWPIQNTNRWMGGTKLGVAVAFVRWNRNNIDHSKITWNNEK